MFPSSVSSGILGLLFVTLGAASASRAAAAATPAPDQVVRLPSFVVEAEGPYTPWRQATVPGFEIISRSPDGLTKDFLEGLHRALTRLEAFIPAEFQGAHTLPYTVLLADPTTMPGMAAGTAAGKDETIAAENLRFLADLRLDDPDSSTVFVLLDEREIADRMFAEMRKGSSLMQVTAQTTPERVPVLLAPGYIRGLLRRRTPALPEWVVVGLSRLAESATFAGNSIQFPAMKDDLPDSWKQAGSALSSFPPLAELFAGPPTGEENKIERGAQWNAEATLLVRCWLDGSEAQRKKFWNFVSRAATEPATESLLKESLGLDYAAMTKRLADYVPRASRWPFSVDVRGMPRAPAPRLRDATKAEEARVRVEWERLRVKYIQSRFPLLGPKYVDEADRALTRSLAAGAGDPAFEGVLGLFYLDTKRPEKAGEHLEAASQSGAVRSRVLLELALLRFIAAARPGELLGPEATRSIMAPLERADRQLPSLSAVYHLAAETMQRSSTPPTAAQLAMLRDGVRLAPRDADLRYATLRLFTAQGRSAEATILAQEGRQFTPADERFRR